MELIRESEKAETEILIEYILNEGNPIRKELRSFFKKMKYKDFISDRGELYYMLEKQVSRFEGFFVGTECEINFFEYKYPPDPDVSNIYYIYRCHISNDNIEDTYVEIHNRNLKTFLKNLLKTMHNIDEYLNKLKLDMPLWKELREGVILRRNLR